MTFMVPCNQDDCMIVSSYGFEWPFTHPVENTFEYSEEKRRDTNSNIFLFLQCHRGYAIHSI